MQKFPARAEAGKPQIGNETHGPTMSRSVSPTSDQGLDTAISTRLSKFLIFH